jgi:hypothetical protein
LGEVRSRSEEKLGKGAVHKPESVTAGKKNCVKIFASYAGYVAQFPPPPRIQKIKKTGSFRQKRTGLLN